jgi:BioD-like phosphotransacetylase family protein
MTIILIASSEPRVGRSVVAAAIAYRMARAGKPVTLARLAGDESANADAAAFAALESVVTPGKAISAADAAKLTGELVLEAPAGSVSQLAATLNARVIAVGLPSSAAIDASADVLAGQIITSVPAADAAAVSKRAGVLAVLLEDRVLAAPSVADIAATLRARTLAGGTHNASVDRVMIGTVSSDAAAPYFANRARTCIITRFDKTDIQLAALQTNLECLVITGGGEPSPYLIDRVAGSHGDVALLLAPEGTVESMHAIEALYATGRFEGAGKLERAVAMLDEAGLPVDL